MASLINHFMGFRLMVRALNSQGPPMMGPPPSSMGPPSMMGPPPSFMGPPSMMGPPPSGMPSPMGPPSSMNPFSGPTIGLPLTDAPPPPGVVPNLVNPESRAHELIIVTAVLLSITTIFVLMRLYTRAFIARCMGWDDYICVLAMVHSYVYSSLQLRMVHYGFGLHMWELPIEKFVPQFPRHLVISSIIHAALIFFAKVSILLLYLRLFGSSRKMKIAIYVTGFIVLAYSVAGTAYGIARSIPTFKNEVMAQPGQSGDWVLTTWGIVNVITDFLILVLPVPTVWGLNASRRQRIALLGIFMIGTFTCITSIIKLRVYTLITKSSIVDLTWALIPWGIWNTVEANVAISCACAVCLKPLMQKVAPSLLSLSRTRASGKDTADSSGTSSNRPWPNKPLDSSYLELGNRPGNHQAYVDTTSKRPAEHGDGMGGIVKTVGVNVRAVEKGHEEK